MLTVPIVYVAYIAGAVPLSFCDFFNVDKIEKEEKKKLRRRFNMITHRESVTTELFRTRVPVDIFPENVRAKYTAGAASVAGSARCKTQKRRRPGRTLRSDSRFFSFFF